jgi:predicted AAA+ superfamily ATPase
MYLGGVGGTGKTQVIKALVNFFAKSETRLTDSLYLARPEHQQHY